ncbi:MAG: MarR family transcriptional regulator [Desulfobacterales bacterium]|jgi:DNA-binding MarR family transcriptional regulator|nr:MarR family transcriptional regulator [Desulfobacteraceae bacterium]MBT4365075.1 MarR family transcriptional regulator [Desulfobacteraceae bacterium]MBT7086155.1 MarR family transcriptional regulator [Desulfobacterales bacterium]MBT7696520.1 MarR family transcriptional regulator [Desulfobacterales bacterium]
MNEILNIMDKIQGRFERILNKVHQVEKKPRDFGSGELLYIAEIHTIVAIEKNPGINTTKLSGLLGVTKGAVSQTIGKLERKAYLKKIKDKNNDKNVLFELTKKGKQVAKGHDKFHREKFSEYLQDLTLSQATIFNEVLEQIETFINNSDSENNI